MVSYVSLCVLKSLPKSSTQLNGISKIASTGPCLGGAGALLALVEVEELVGALKASDFCAMSAARGKVQSEDALFGLCTPQGRASGDYFEFFSG